MALTQMQRGSGRRQGREALRDDSYHAKKAPAEASPSSFVEGLQLHALSGLPQARQTNSQQRGDLCAQEPQKSWPSALLFAGGMCPRKGSDWAEGEALGGPGLGCRAARGRGGHGGR